MRRLSGVSFIFGFLASGDVMSLWGFVLSAFAWGQPYDVATLASLQPRRWRAGQRFFLRSLQIFPARYAMI